MTMWPYVVLIAIILILASVAIWRRTDHITLIRTNGAIAERGIRPDAGLVIMYDGVAYVQTRRRDADGFVIYQQGYRTIDWGNESE